MRSLNKTRQMAKMAKIASKRAEDDVAFLDALAVKLPNSDDFHHHIPHAPPHMNLLNPDSISALSSSSTPRKRRYRVTSSIHAKSSGHADHREGGVRHEEHKDDYRDLHFKQTVLSRRLSLQMNAGGHNILNPMMDTGNKQSHSMTRRISNATLRTGHRRGSIPWYEAVAHHEPGSHITDAETTITRSSILQNETQFIRSFSSNAKKAADLHIQKEMHKESRQVKHLHNENQKLLYAISRKSLRGECVAAIVSRSERHSLKEHIRKAFVSRGKVMLDRSLANRKQLVKDIYNRTVERRRSLDSSFNFGRNLMMRMTRLLDVCSSRLSHHEQTQMLTSMHAEGLNVGRTNNEDGVSLLHSKLALSPEMTHSAMEIFDGGLTVIVSDEVMEHREKIMQSNHGGAAISKDKFTRLIESRNWVCSLTSRGPARRRRRDEPHKYLPLVERELTAVLGYQLPKVLNTNGAVPNLERERGRQMQSKNLSAVKTMFSLARVLDAIHPIPGKRIAGAIAKAPHRMAKILSDRCEILGLGSFTSLNSDSENKRNVMNGQGSDKNETPSKPKTVSSVFEGASDDNKKDVIKILTRIHESLRDYTCFMFEWHPFLQVTSVSTGEGIAPIDVKKSTAESANFVHPPPPSSHKHHSRGRVPWIVGLSKPTGNHHNALQSYAGQHMHSFGLSCLGTIHHNGVTKRYCDPTLLSSCDVIGMVVDLAIGRISFFANGKNLGVAFGPDAICFTRNLTEVMLQRKTIIEQHLVPCVALADKIWDEDIWRSGGQKGTAHPSGLSSGSDEIRMRNTSFESEESSDTSAGNKKASVAFNQPAMSLNFGGFSFAHPKEGVCGFDTYLSFSDAPTAQLNVLDTSKIRESGPVSGGTSGDVGRRSKSVTASRLMAFASADNRSVEEICDDAIISIRDHVNFLKLWTPEEEVSWSIYSPEPGVPHFLEVSARKLQAFTRRAMGRKWRKGTRFLMYLSIIKVQRLVRRKLPRIRRKKQKAATKIQSQWRAREARRRLQRIRQFSQFPAWEVDSVLAGAVVRLQCCVRMSQARRRYMAKRNAEENTHS